MKLQQLRYALEVYRHNLNVSEAAEALFTSQPGVSKQIRLLEDELGVPIFVRHGKRIIAVTAPGKMVLDTAERIRREVGNIKRIGTEFAARDDGTLTIATTHTQAKYVLPSVVTDFLKLYPRVKLTLLPSGPSQLEKMVLDGEADFAIGTEAGRGHSELRKLTCYAWNRAVVVPDGHPLLSLGRPLELQDIAAHPLITYEFAFRRDSQIARAFINNGIPAPSVALASDDTDIIKTYVRLGLGIGLIAETAFDTDKDEGLHIIDAGHLFEPSFSHIILRQGSFLRGFGFSFLELFAPFLSREKIEATLYAPPEEDFSI